MIVSTEESGGSEQRTKTLFKYIFRIVCGPEGGFGDIEFRKMAPNDEAYLSCSRPMGPRCLA